MLARFLPWALPGTPGTKQQLSAIASGSKFGRSGSKKIYQGEMMSNELQMMLSFFGAFTTGIMIALEFKLVKVRPLQAEDNDQI